MFELFMFLNLGLIQKRYNKQLILDFYYKFFLD